MRIGGSELCKIRNWTRFRKLVDFNAAVNLFLKVAFKKRNHHLPESAWTWWAWPSCWPPRCGSSEGLPPWTSGRACRLSEKWRRAWRTPASRLACWAERSSRTCSQPWIQNGRGSKQKLVCEDISSREWKKKKNLSRTHAEHVSWTMRRCRRTLSVAAEYKPSWFNRAISGFQYLKY